MLSKRLRSLFGFRRFFRHEASNVDEVVKNTQGLSPDRLALLHEMPKGGVCAEIGVWIGDFSSHILEQTQPTQLYLVDPWLFAPHYPKRLYGGKKAASQAAMDDVEEFVRQRFMNEPRVCQKRMSSASFFAQIEGGTLDWVYIDGDHSAHAVLADLRGAWDAVRAGGFVVGDDFFWQDADGSLSVRLAVEQFAQERGLEVRRFGAQYLFQRTP